MNAQHNGLFLRLETGICSMHSGAEDASAFKPYIEE